MRVTAVIPARMGSSRFPGKPIKPILGRPMIEHVYRRVVLSEAVDEAFIATCDKEIYDTAQAFGAPVIMTADTHDRASDRVAEAAEKIESDLIVLVQGDEPMIIPESIDQAVAPFRDHPDVRCVNLTKRIDTEEEFLSRNTIKVVMDQNWDAIYMSREPIPTLLKDGVGASHTFKQVCIIPFRPAALAEYAALSPTPLEAHESIDMLRFIESGRKVRMVETEFETYAVDTLADLDRVEALMANDVLAANY
jgi:3-deoxy-manno-octulosonate cytidylyltransferase (CMP-KDO synthetase)